MSDMSKRRQNILMVITALVFLGIFLGYLIASHQSWIGEQPGTANYVHKTIGLISDLPHSTVEVFWAAVENILTFTVLWTIGKSRLHKQIDAEHGFSHDEDGSVHKIDKPS
jgi:hypothetical protein